MVQKRVPFEGCCFNPKALAAKQGILGRAQWYLKFKLPLNDWGEADAKYREGMMNSCQIVLCSNLPVGLVLGKS